MTGTLFFAASLATRLIAPSLPWSSGPMAIFGARALPASVANVSAPATTALKSGSAQGGVPTVQRSTPANRPVVTSYDPAAAELLRSSPPPDVSDLASGILGAAKLISKGDFYAAEATIVPIHNKYPGDDSAALIVAELLVKRGYWQDAATFLAGRRCDGNEPNYKFLKAAVLAHLGYTFAGEREDLAGAVERRNDNAFTPEFKAEVAAFGSSSPHDIEALAWFLGADAVGTSVGNEGRALEYCNHFAELCPGDFLNTIATASCLNGLRRYNETIRLLRPLLRTTGDRDQRAVLESTYDWAFKRLNN